MTILRHVLVASDLSARSDRALERAVTLAREGKAKLSVIYAIDDELPARIAGSLQKAAEQLIREHVGSISGSPEIHIAVSVAFGKAYEVILVAAQNANADLIVVGISRGDASSDLFCGTTAERVVRLGRHPVLLVRERIKGPYRRVLVGVDFSVYSRRAIEFALKSFPGCDFSFVHAYQVPFKGFLYGSDTQNQARQEHEAETRQMVTEEFAALLHAADAELPSPSLVIQEGAAQQVLREAVDRAEADLLVVGTHGRTGVAHALLGSVAEDILRDPPCDVLAIKAW